MSYLVDTHVFLWILFDPSQLTPKVKKAILDSAATKYISSITFWEISLKFSLGKLDLNDIRPEAFPSIAKEAGFESISPDADIMATFYKLPKKHKDPFDRMLIWEAMQRRYIRITKDHSFSLYEDSGLKILW